MSGGRYQTTSVRSRGMSLPGGWLPEHASHAQRIASDGLPAVPTPEEVARHGGGSLAPIRRRPARALLVTVAVALGLAACAFAILVLVGLNTGPSGFVLGAVLAILPVPVLVAAFRWLDRYEPEPRRYLIFAFVWGAAVATLVAIFLNELGASLFFPTPGDSESPGLAAVFVAPPVEEAAKGVVVLILAWRRRIDGIIDGIVFAGLTGVGFAFTENILYIGRAYAEASGELGTGSGVFIAVVVFVVRGVVSPFAHPLFTMSIGVAVGLAVRRRSVPVRVGLTILGFVVAMALHGVWNGTAIQGLGGFALAYLLIMLPALGVAVGAALWFRRREGRVLGWRLPAFAESGWIAPHEVALLSSLSLRTLALDLARRWGGDPARDATKAYHDQVIALGFLRDRLARGRLGAQGLHQQVEMLAALPSLRSRAVVPPPPRPLAPGPWSGARPPGRQAVTPRPPAP